MRLTVLPPLRSPFGSTAVGICCKDGVVLGVQKEILSKMLVPGSGRRIATVDRHAGLALTGLPPDGRQIAARAKAEASNYKSFYGETIPANTLADRVASYVHLFTLYWSVRIFGTGALLACYDRDGPALFNVEPSGQCFKYSGSAIGKGRQYAKTELEKLKLGELTCREAVVEVAKIIYGSHDESKDKAFELELSWVCEESGKEHVRVPKDLAEAAEAAAKAAAEDSDSDSDMDD